jgi:TolB-like protein/DNA-binding winged helix-turn-helix (wHTH) protein
VKEQTQTAIRVGEWRVDPAAGEISRYGETLRLEERTMRVLLRLVERAGDVVSIDELLNAAWGDVAVSQDSVYQAVASLRRVLGDDPKQPSYIATVPRLGYRLVAKVSPEGASSAQGGDKSAERPGIKAKWAVVAVVLVGAAVVTTWTVLLKKRVPDAAQVTTAVQSPKSIGVLPFLDLTEGMKEEEFADGMTEELIDKLSRIPGLRVPAPTASFYFKGKQAPLAEMAKTLGVAYVLDGSVRKSEKRLRVAARLVRADNGYVMWTETYDRPLIDKLVVQEDIASEVAKALRAEIERPNAQ